jgi:hypothetical protein
VAKARRQRAQGNGLTLTMAFGGTRALLLGVLLASSTARAADMKSPGALVQSAVHGGLLADRATPVSTRPHSCRCTREYKPVCGRPPGGAARTFPNACVARCAGAGGIRGGRC